MPGSRYTGWDASAMRSIRTKRKILARLTIARATPARLIGLRSSMRSRWQGSSWSGGVCSVAMLDLGRFWLVVGYGRSCNVHFVRLLPQQSLKCRARALHDSGATSFFRPTTPSSSDKHRDRRTPDRSATRQSPALPAPLRRNEWRSLRRATSGACDCPPQPWPTASMPVTAITIMPHTSAQYSAFSA